jgi:hypothetical protein
MNPLDQLKDIHLPQTVSYWPPAWPWWVLVLTIIAACAFIIWHKKRQAWRKHAIQQLESFNWEQPNHAYRDVNKLLKQICIHKIDKTSANLSGETWLNFLDSKIKQPIFMSELKPFAHILDEPNIQMDPMALKDAAKRWIRKVKC